jgi:hypothetical protein
LWGTKERGEDQIKYGERSNNTGGSGDQQTYGRGGIPGGREYQRKVKGVMSGLHIRGMIWGWKILGRDEEGGVCVAVLCGWERDGTGEEEDGLHYLTLEGNHGFCVARECCAVLFLLGFAGSNEGASGRGI